MLLRRRKLTPLAFAGVNFYVLKAAIATAVAAVLPLLPQTNALLGGAGEWVLITTVVIASMGPTLGGVISRGVNRGVGTLAAALLAVPLNLLLSLAPREVTLACLPIAVLLVTTVAYSLLLQARTSVAYSEWEYALTLFNLTFCMLLMVNHKEGVMSSAARVGTILCGALLALVAAAMWPYLASDRLAVEAAVALNEAGNLVHFSASKFTRACGKHALRQDESAPTAEVGDAGEAAASSAPQFGSEEEEASASAAVQDARKKLAAARSNVKKNIAFARWEPRRGPTAGAKTHVDPQNDVGFVAAGREAGDTGRIFRAVAAAVMHWIRGGELKPLLASYTRLEKEMELFEQAAASLDALGVSGAQVPPLSCMRSLDRSSVLSPLELPTETLKMGDQPRRAEVPLSAPLRHLAGALREALQAAGSAIGMLPLLVRREAPRLLAAQAPNVCDGEAHARGKFNY